MPRECGRLVGADENPRLDGCSHPSELNSWGTNCGRAGKERRRDMASARFGHSTVATDEIWGKNGALCWSQKNVWFQTARVNLQPLSQTGFLLPVYLVELLMLTLWHPNMHFAVLVVLWDLCHQGWWRIQSSLHGFNKAWTCSRT